MDTVFKEGLWENCVIAPTFLVCRGEIKGLETLAMLIKLMSEKRLVFHEKLTPAFH